MKERWAIALATLVAGRYSATYGASDVGITRDGYEIEVQAHAEEINKSDKYGDTLIDTVTRGASYRGRFVSREYKAGSLSAFWPYGTTLGTIATTAAPIGRLGSAIGLPLVLTATAGTPAATAPATLTAALAVLAPGFPGKLLFDSRLRDVPIELVFLPSEAGGNVTTLVQT